LNFADPLVLTAVYASILKAILGLILASLTASLAASLAASLTASLAALRVTLLAAYTNIDVCFELERTSDTSLVKRVRINRYETLIRLICA
jgi:uncharacterized protein YacL